MNYKCTKNQSSRTTKNSQNCNKLKVPAAVSESYKSITDISDIHAGVLLDYLSKVCSLNKKLISNYESLNHKYSELNDRIKNTEERLVSSDPQKTVISSTESSEINSSISNVPVEITNYKNKNENLN